MRLAAFADGVPRLCALDDGVLRPVGDYGDLAELVAASPGTPLAEAVRAASLGAPIANWDRGARAKFHGVISPTTPTGSRRNSHVGTCSDAQCSPNGRHASLAENRRIRAARRHSTSASGRGLPISRVISSPQSPAPRLSRSAAATSRSPRCAAGFAAQASKEAARALSTARSTSAARQQADFAGARVAIFDRLASAAGFPLARDQHQPVALARRRRHRRGS
jgi:hypothetical protein